MGEKVQKVQPDFYTIDSSIFASLHENILTIVLFIFSAISSSVSHPYSVLELKFLGEVLAHPYSDPSFRTNLKVDPSFDPTTANVGMSGSPSSVA